MVKAGLQAIYLSGWQVAADANLSEQVYPDQSLYAANSVPAVVRRINNALRRADQIEWAESGRPAPTATATGWSPIVADAEAGFGGALNAFELMKGMIEAGRGRRALRGPAVLGEEVRPHGRQGAHPDRPAHPHPDRGPPGRRRAATSPPLVVARTDSLGATLLTSDVDERDRQFCTGERSRRGLLPRHGRASTSPSPAAWPTPRTPT